LPAQQPAQLLSADAWLSKAATCAKDIAMMISNKTRNKPIMIVEKNKQRIM
jgi:hypothetical protein